METITIDDSEIPKLIESIWEEEEKERENEKL